MRGQMRASRNRVTSVAVSLVMLLSAVTVWGMPTLARAADPARPLNLEAGPNQVRVTRGAEFSVLANVFNDRLVSVAEGTLTAGFSGEPLADQSAVTSWSSGETAIADAGIASVSTPALDPSGQADLSVQIPGSALRSSGVWGGWARWDASGQSTVSRFFVVVAGSNAPVNVNLVYALSGTGTAEGLYSEADVNALTSSDSVLSSEVAALAAVNATVAVDPRLPASIRALGNRTSDATNAFLNQLTQLPVTFALPYADADLSLQAQTNSNAQLLPGEFRDQDEERRDAITAWNEQLPQVAWPLPASIGPDDAAVFRAWGYQNMFINSGSIQPVTVKSQAGGRSQSTGSQNTIDVNTVNSALLDNSTIWVTNDQLSRAFSEALTARTSAGAFSSVSEVIALAAFRSGQDLFISSERATPRTAQRLGEVLSALTESKAIRFVSHEDIVAGATVETLGAVEISAAGVPEEASNQLRVLLANERKVSNFATVAVEPEALRDIVRRELLASTDARFRNTSASWQSSIAEFQAYTSAILGGVRLATGSSINVLSSAVSIPVSVINDLPVAVRVVLNVSPSNGRLVIDPVSATTIEPLSRQTVPISVQANIGNGPVDLKMQLFDTKGNRVGDSVSVPANVQADWEGVSATILAVLVLTLLVFGIVRQYRRTQRLKTARD